MTIPEIKAAVDSGKIVQFATPAYRVIKDDKGQYLIICVLNNSCIGLTNQSGDILNGEESDFTII